MSDVVETFEQRLDPFRTLNWDGDGAAPITVEAEAAAKAFMANPSDVAGGYDGGLLLIWNVGQKSMVLHIAPTGELLLAPGLGIDAIREDNDQLLDRIVTAGRYATERAANEKMLAAAIVREIRQFAQRGAP